MVRTERSDIPNEVNELVLDQDLHELESTEPLRSTPEASSLIQGEKHQKQLIG